MAELRLLLDSPPFQGGGAARRVVGWCWDIRLRVEGHVIYILIMIGSSATPKHFCVSRRSRCDAVLGVATDLRKRFPI